MTAEIEALYRAESRRIFATLVRLLGDFDLAEEALHDAFKAAMEQWPTQGLPANPRAWLVSAGRFKAIDGIRRNSRHGRFTAWDDAAEQAEAVADEAPTWDEQQKQARLDEHGDLVPLDEQNRALWNATQIAEGCALTEQALRTPHFGAYSLQAAISAVHAEAPTALQTDWPQIVGLYDALLSKEPSPVVALNRAVAVAMASGPAVGLPLVTVLLQDESLQNYHLAHAAQADLLRRLGRHQEAFGAYQRALALTSQAAEQRFLQRKIATVKSQVKIIWIYVDLGLTRSTSCAS